MSNKYGPRNGVRQEVDQTLDHAKAECDFNDRLYEILLAHQRGQIAKGRPPAGVPPGNVGELDASHSYAFNLIWSVAQKLSGKSKEEQEVIA